ncbi:MmcQ/YjbR family DNA-binding protein [Flavisolibacter sp. BT320]|nr:MmcQ/YjbR family DNA-binding protein [Flavisolibacter longurius]
MVTIDTLRKLATSFPGVTEEPHFEKISFRVKKKIFATYDDKNKRACLKLSETSQDVFCLADKTVIYPVANKWGKQGWTLVEMKKLRKELFADAVTTAYCETAPKKLAEQVRPQATGTLSPDKLQ